ncbi:MAG: hypothetical protein EON54_08535 [Alcaligenaceae bacterium]|nr:MAG: hypothetical protein EON54_08535 [Alcaligenaceae bacterium]
MKKVLALATCAVFAAALMTPAFAKGGSGGRSSYSGSSHSSSHGGSYRGGSGSSHRGGTYSSPRGDGNYGTHKK